ncbi:hypothetical protein BLNAU_10042 [Blattamonas nauphoetae]|uniref:Uncharacterized protein n=1 Tax=Blattamonas nauphoetae TaxID=2049346 RepID=A0ABQ9XTV0_9EUKA|nr:hypothetical protein BLNAU_10042 [Blattamonas nauphoetae]
MPALSVPSAENQARPPVNSGTEPRVATAQTVKEEPKKEDTAAPVEEPKVSAAEPERGEIEEEPDKGVQVAEAKKEDPVVEEKEKDEVEKTEEPKEEVTPEEEKKLCSVCSFQLYELTKEEKLRNKGSSTSNG